MPTFVHAAVEEHHFTTVDGQQIGAWFVRPTSHHTTVILLHGNGGSRSSMGWLMQMLAFQHSGIRSLEFT